MLLAILATVALLTAKAPDITPGPPVGDVHRVALDNARIEMGDVTKWKKRAKISAVLPRLQLDYANRLRYNVNVDVSDNVYVGSENVVIGPEEGSYKQTEDNSHYIGVKAVWALNELIFSRDSLAVSHEALTVMRERNALLDSVNKHYFERKKLIGEIAELSAKKVPRADIPKKEHELFVRRIAMDKETAALDALTGGWFTTQLNN